MHAKTHRLTLLILIILHTNGVLHAHTLPTLSPNKALELEEISRSFSDEAPVVSEVQTYLNINNVAKAQLLLKGLSSPAAKLMHLRLSRQTGDFEQAQALISALKKTKKLSLLVQLEEGLLAIAQEKYKHAISRLLPLLKQNLFIAQKVALPLAKALAQTSPQQFMQHKQNIQKVLNKQELGAKSHFMALWREALIKLGKHDEAKAVALKQFIEEPVSDYSPKTPPRKLDHKERLKRGENFLSAHRNPKVIETLKDIPENLNKKKLCRWHFALGMAHRKLHHYTPAQEHLNMAINTCQDNNLVRRASYVHAKVISIRSGLQAIEPIEKFAIQFKGHSMVDDVLFWAGDLYQRRELYEQANRYFSRAQNLSTKGDYCAESLWRTAWIAFREKQFKKAETILEKVFNAHACVKDIFHHSRARYWLGRLAQLQNKRNKAIKYWQDVIEKNPLSFYAQISLARLQDYAPKIYKKIRPQLLAPQGGQLPKLCPGKLATNKTFVQALQWLRVGLKDEAAALLNSIQFPKQEIIAGTHAAVLGVEAKERASNQWDLSDACHPMAPKLLHTLLLDMAGAHHLAHWRLRTEFAFIFSSFPTSNTIALWRAAYPLAYREFIGPAEEKNGLPVFLLQAIAREESAFDAQVVSWAGAYGLTQLILPTARSTLKLMKTQRKLESPEELLDVEFNTSLGGALLGSLMRRFDQQSALAIAAYNAGEKVTAIWWKRHAEQGFDRMSEEITIRETRQYVKRVLRTYGIYNWLYGEEPPLLKMRLKLKKN